MQKIILLLLKIVILRHFYLHSSYQFGHLVDTEAVLYPHIADTGAAQCREMAAAAESRSDVAGESTDICAFAAHNPDGNALLRVFEKLYLVYYENLRFKLHFLAEPGKLIGTYPFYLAGGECRWYLLYSPRKVLKGLLHEFTGDMGGRISGVYFSLEVEGGGCGAKCYGGNILLDSGLQFIDAFGGAPGAYNHHAGGEGVERTGMAYLYLLDFKTPGEGSADALYGVERGPLQWFVDI